MGQTLRKSPQSSTDLTQGSLPNHRLPDDIVLKLLVVGDRGVGKTCLVQRLAGDSYSDEYVPTIGIDTRIKTLHLDGKGIKLLTREIGAEVRPPGIDMPPYYDYLRGINGFIVVYDVSDKRSFIDVDGYRLDYGWYLAERENSIKLLVGNKCDLTAERVVDYTTAKRYADENGFTFIETSAKTDTNIEAALMAMVKSKEEIH